MNADFYHTCEGASTLLRSRGRKTFRARTASRKQSPGRSSTFIPAGDIASSSLT